MTAPGGQAPALPGDGAAPVASGDAGQSGPPTAVELDRNVAQWLVYIRQCNAQIKQLEEARDNARRHIEAALGDAEVGLVDGQPAVRWTWVHSKRLDQRKLKEQAPELVEACTVPVVSRRFSLGGDS